jgi:hypothetical protein
MGASALQQEGILQKEDQAQTLRKRGEGRDMAVALLHKRAVPVERAHVGDGELAFDGRTAWQGVYAGTLRTCSRSARGGDARAKTPHTKVGDADHELQRTEGGAAAKQRPIDRTSA